MELSKRTRYTDELDPAPGPPLLHQMGLLVLVCITDADE